MLHPISSRRLAAAVTVGVMTCVLTGCGRIETPRDKVVGIWEFTGMELTGRLIYRKNGTVVELFPESDKPGAAWVTGALGKWWLEDHILGTDVEFFTIDGTARRVTRSVIASFNDDRLVSGDGHSDWIRVYPTVARSSQYALILRGIAGLIALGAAIYGASRSHLRRTFLLLGAGAICTLFATGLGWPEEFVKTGDWVISSLSLLEALRLPRDIFQSAAAIFFAGAFASLAISIRRREA